MDRLTIQMRSDVYVLHKMRQPNIGKREILQQLRRARKGGLPRPSAARTAVREYRPAAV
jgi:hypothetical protein